VLAFGMTHHLVIAAIFKNENPYLREWLEYHRLVGVDHFYLYDNDCGEEALALLAPYESAGLVTRHPWIHYDGTKHDRPTRFGGQDKNHLAFNHAARHHRRECEWLMKIDVDEFLVPLEGDAIPPLLARYDRRRIKGIQVPRINFGHSGHRDRPKGLVIESYLEREAAVSDHKDIANTDFLTDNDWMNSAHRWGYRWLSGGRLVRPRDVQGMRVHHYYTKSLEESRSRQNMMRTRPVTEAEWERQNAHLNAVHDETMLRFAAEVRRRVEANDAMPEATETGRPA
jgi:hypothetical protein